jgi:hypothetical protein
LFTNPSISLGFILFGGFEMKKPEVKLIGEDGNIFNLMGIASRALKEAGQNDQAVEMVDKIVSTAKSYHEALAILMEYVEVI